MTDDFTPARWKQLLTLLLAQRLELNAVESALKASGVLAEGQLREIRVQAQNTAQSWTSRENDDALALLRAHSSPLASMSVPPPE
jgi:hypothetical protein